MQKRTRPRKRYIILILAIAVVALIGVYFGAQWLEDQENKPQPRGDYKLRYEDEMITLNGVKYRQRSNLTTILLMGVDKDNERSSGQVPAYLKYMDGGQADFLRLIVIDPTEKTIAQIAIDRDTMTPITVLGTLGSKVGYRTSQICLSHGFGDGKEQSCEFTVEAVSNLLFNVPIKYYIALDMDGISILNDLVGGVTVTLEDDFSMLDPTMTKGTTMTLVGDQAEIFVRSRMSVGVGTNEARMARQQHFINSIMELLNAHIHEDKEFVGTLFDALSENLVASIGRAQMLNEAWVARDYRRIETMTPEGTHQIGSDGYMEFHVNEDSLEQIVLDVFYQKAK